MRVTDGIKSFITLIAIVVFQSACAPSDQSKTIQVTFDGEACGYDGPDKGTEGDWIINLDNRSDISARLYVVRLASDKTWQDFVEYIGEPGSAFVPVPWAATNIMTKPLDEPGSIEYKLKGGFYGINCCTGYEEDLHCHVWPGGSLQVITE